MELTKEQVAEIRENIQKLEKKYSTLTNLLEQIDGEMHELFVISEDLRSLMATNQD